jgi:hypothetical protein
MMMMMMTSMTVVIMTMIMMLMIMHNNDLIHSGPGVNMCERPELRSTIYIPPQTILMDNEWSFTHLLAYNRYLVYGGFTIIITDP